MEQCVQHSTVHNAMMNYTTCCSNIVRRSSTDVRLYLSTITLSHWPTLYSTGRSSSGQSTKPFRRFCGQCVILFSPRQQKWRLYTIVIFTVCLSVCFSYENSSAGVLVFNLLREVPYGQGEQIWVLGSEQRWSARYPSTSQP